MNRPTSKDKAWNDYADYIEKKLVIYESSPHAKTYLTILNQINSFNDQLTIADAVVATIEGKEIKIQPGRIDLFGSKDDKEFDRAWKYMVESYDLHVQLDKFRAKMTEAEKKQVDAGPKLRAGSTAEKYIFNK